MLNPFVDSTPFMPLSEGECEILGRLERGDKLHIHRHYSYDVTERKAVYSWTFFWDYNDHPYDHNVWMLLMRGLIRPVTCAGGAIWFIPTGAPTDV